ncbi:unnamed protein product [Musa acuminata subsp. malaccensis]|uniref:Ninja-family protein n=1 Tax=Musa acuminata subsp. malaccensis TaxID=214687 RepID=A0A8D7AJY4_MUSAM|nr:unnamed protein product [Musa acuminata subsp. malaccensis]
MDSLSRDFLRSFAGNGYGDEPLEATEGESDEIELSLGLSLGGCFGVDPKGKKLVRSSSIASFSSLNTERGFRATHAAAALTRTSSLPVEVEEERQKRKEVQSLRRLEAKRKRLERRNSIRSGAAKPGEKPNEDVNGGKESPAVAAEQMAADNGQLGSLGGARNGFPPPGLPSGPAAWKRAADMAGCFPPISQGSIGSQGSCSTGACGVDGRPPQGKVSTHTSVSYISICSKHSYLIAAALLIFTVLQAHHIGFAFSSFPTCLVTETKNSVRGDEEQVVAGRANGVKEMERRMMEKMPFVSTKGDGPNGRRIEGFLYKYGRGEEVRIVCVCHGSFLTPAEFVKHAGGGDVANPLRHIVVNSSPFL